MANVRNHELFAWNPIDGTLYTNGVDVIWFFTDLEPRSLPNKYYATSLEVNGLYDTQVESMCRIWPRRQLY